MSYNIIVPFPKKSDAPSEKVKKVSRDLDDIEKPLVTTIDTVDKEEKSKNMWRRKPTLLLFHKKRILK